MIRNDRIARPVGVFTGRFEPILRNGRFSKRLGKVVTVSAGQQTAPFKTGESTDSLSWNESETSGKPPPASTSAHRPCRKPKPFSHGQPGDELDKETR